MSQQLKKIWNLISGVLVVLVVLLAVLLAGVRLAGFHVFSIVSGSMEPQYPVGSLIYVKPVDTNTLQEGDVISFMLNEDTVATHRIVAVMPDENNSDEYYFQTKGDANEAVDGSLVYYKNVVGTPVFTIPCLGYLATFIQTPPGCYAAVACAALILLIVFLPDVLFTRSDKQSGRNKSIQTAGKFHAVGNQQGKGGTE